MSKSVPYLAASLFAASLISLSAHADTQMPGAVGVVVGDTAQNYHDLHDTFMGPADVAALNKRFFDALKPGGIYLVIDHVAEAGSGLRDTESLHRIDPKRL
jgi:predicted methyltransferase